jgi:uncharacterized protein
LFFACNKNQQAKRFNEISEAIKSDNITLMLKLLSDFSDKNEKNFLGYSLMHICVFEKNLDALDALIQSGGNIYIRDELGRGLLSHAVELNEKRIIIYLLNNNYKCNIKDESGATPLYYAKTVDIVKLLIERGASINVIDVFGETILKSYYANGFMEGVGYLLSLGADPKIKNRRGVSVEMLAEKDGIDLNRLK